jgi:hypothetical protein
MQHRNGSVVAGPEQLLYELHKRNPFIVEKRVRGRSSVWSRLSRRGGAGWGLLNRIDEDGPAFGAKQPLECEQEEVAAPSSCTLSATILLTTFWALVAKSQPNTRSVSQS